MNADTAQDPAQDGWRPFVSVALARVVLWVVGGATVLLFIARAIPSWAAWLNEIDRAWWERMAAVESVAPMALARLLEVVGGAWVTVPLRVLVAVYLGVRGWGRRLRFWILAMVPAELLNLLLKALYDRPRPPGQMSHTINAAFPSGHTTTAAAIAFGLVLVLARPGHRRLLAWIFALGWTVSMAWSRTYLRDHWLTDVVGGAGLGIACVLVAGLLCARDRAGPRID